MKHWVRSAVFRSLEALPQNLGDGVYHFLQRRVGRVSAERSFELQLQRFGKMSDVLEGLGFTIEGGTVTEIGSGWFPIMPYLMLFEGKAQEVWSYDIYKHYSREGISEVNDIFSSRMAPLPPEVEFCTSTGLPSALRYLPHTDVSEDPPPTGSIDLLISSCVLEHMQPDKILEVHKRARSFLKSGGLIFHLISPSDHRAHTDSSLSLYDFLRLSPGEWDKIQTRFDYHNRLRLPQYREIFRAAGFEIAFEEYSWPHNQAAVLREFSSMDLDPSFSGFSVEELTAGGLIFVLSG